MDIPVNTSQHRKYFAQRFGLWLAIATIIMMFGGFTSAYIVKKANIQNWHVFPLPIKFLYSTILILISSGTLVLASKAYSRAAYRLYGRLLGLTCLFGITFLVLQVFAWKDMIAQGLMLNEDTAAAFLYIISGMHALHVVAGVFILFYSWVMLKRKIARSVLIEDKLPSASGLNRVSMLATFWHFVDILWIYLFLFLLLYR